MMADKASTRQTPKNFLATSVSPHLRRLAAVSPQVKRQFFPIAGENESNEKHGDADPLNEEHFIPVKGVIHKYPGRVLIETTLACAAYCQFCTRGRKVSEITRGQLSSSDITTIVTYLGDHEEIREVIFSGGDPFMAPTILQDLLTRIDVLSHITIIRIHTRVPISNPSLYTDVLEDTLKQCGRPLYISLHFEHPDEITPETIAVINRLRKIGAILLSQTVFLKGINDDYDVLFQLFNRLVEIGVRPYYIHRCDPVIGAERFQVSFEREVDIMTRLRKNLSGIACPTYVIDAPRGLGKVPPPLSFWNFDKTYFYDFEDCKINL